MGAKTTVTVQELNDIDIKKMIFAKGKLDYINAEVEFPNPDDGGQSIIKGEFKVCDGFALGICEVEGEIKEIYAQYPLCSLINNQAAAKTMKESILEFLDIKEERDVTPLEVFQTYGTFKFVENI